MINRFHFQSVLNVHQLMTDFVPTHLAFDYKVYICACGASPFPNSCHLLCVDNTIFFVTSHFIGHRIVSMELADGFRK